LIIYRKCLSLSSIPDNEWHVDHYAGLLDGQLACLGCCEDFCRRLQFAGFGLVGPNYDVQPAQWAIAFGVWWIVEHGRLKARHAISLDTIGEDVNVGESVIYDVSQRRHIEKLAHCGYFRLHLGKAEEACSVLIPSTAFLRTSNEPSAAIYSLWYLGFAYLQLGRFREAKQSLLESQALLQKNEDGWFHALADEYLGTLARGEGIYSQPQLYLKAALIHFRELGDPLMTSHVLSDLGHIMQKLGDLNQAETLLQKGLKIARELEYCRFAVGTALAGLGQVAYARGDNERARALFTESADLFQQIGDTHHLTQVLTYQGFNTLALGALSDAQIQFCIALKLAQQGGLIPSMLDALMGLVILAARQGTSEETLDLILYILQHPASTQDTKNRAAQLNADLQTKYSQEQIELVEQRVRLKNLDEIIRLFQIEN
jgi:tetratricopeptide (TPR) repeat protein